MSEMISAAEYRLFCRIRDKDPDLFPLSGVEQQIMYASMKSGLIKTDPKGDLYLASQASLLMQRYEEQLEKERADYARQEAAQKSSEEATDKRWRKDAFRSWAQFWLGILFSAIGFVAGAFVEHYFAVLDALHTFVW